MVARRMRVASERIYDDRCRKTNVKLPNNAADFDIGVNAYRTALGLLTCDWGRIKNGARSQDSKDQRIRDSNSEITNVVTDSL